MPQIGTLEGSGELLDDDRSLGTVRYKIDVSQYRDDWLGKDVRTAKGELIGSEITMGRLSSVGQATLVLDDGQKITVLMDPRYFLLGSDRADVLVRGSVPGFGTVS